MKMSSHFKMVAHLRKKMDSCHFWRTFDYKALNTLSKWYRDMLLTYLSVMQRDRRVLSKGDTCAHIPEYFQMRVSIFVLKAFSFDKWATTIKNHFRMTILQCCNDAAIFIPRASIKPFRFITMCHRVYSIGNQQKSPKHYATVLWYLNILIPPASHWKIPRFTWKPTPSRGVQTFKNEKV